MDIYSRFNYQRGIPEDQRYKSTIYSRENTVDNWIAARKQMKDLFYSKIFEEKKEEIANEIISEIEKTLNDHFH